MNLRIEVNDFGYLLIGISVLLIICYAVVHLLHTKNPRKKLEIENDLFSRLNKIAKKILQNKK